MSISFVRTALLAGLVCLSAACSSLDSSMKRYVGKPIDIIYERYGREPDVARKRVGENRYSYFWRFTYYYPGGREYQGSSQNGPIITNYYSNVCYGQHSDRTFFTDSEGIIIDYHWALSNSWRVNCNNHVLGRPPR